jgi:hypothetical protein
MALPTGTAALQHPRDFFAVRRNRSCQPNQCTQIINEKDILQDTLMSQKHITSAYNTYAGECVNQQLRGAMLGILDDEHKIQADISAPCSRTAGTRWIPPSSRS